MKIYVAAPWVRKADAIQAGELLKAAGHEITSRWFEHEGDPNDPTGATVASHIIRQQARDDMEDVVSADVVVVLNLEKSEGKAVETGIAIAMGVPVVSVGKRSNIFQSLGKEVVTLEDAIEYLRD